MVDPFVQEKVPGTLTEPPVRVDVDNAVPTIISSAVGGVLIVGVALLIVSPSVIVLEYAL
jgi:hypothetical protein